MNAAAPPAKTAGHCDGGVADRADGLDAGNGMAAMDRVNESDDAALLRRVAGGERVAFEMLFRRFQPRLRGFVRRITGDPSLAEEIADDVMMTVWQNAARFEFRSKPSTWIFGIAHRSAANGLRRRKRVDSEPRLPVDATTDTSGQVEAAQWLEAAFAKLSNDHRSVMELTIIHGFSYEEIAQITECPVNTVKTRMFHARRHLQAELVTQAQPAEDAP